MVKVIFYNLLRSKYGITELSVTAGSITEIIGQILRDHPKIHAKDFETAVVFHKGKPYHFSQFRHMISDEDEIIITHFVGGG